MVIPTVLDLRSHLKKNNNMRYCLPLVSALIKSLEKRFKGIFAKCLMVEHIPLSILTPAELPFGNRAYFLAVFLDHRFSLQ